MNRWENNLVDRRKVHHRDTLNIPIDLIIEILSRLPAKSIAICRCVSKQLASLLRSPDFTESFLTISSARPRILFTFGFGGKWHFLSTPQPQDLDKELTVVAEDYHIGSTGYPGNKECLSVHGFICLINKTYRVPVICNHCTGQYLILPRVKARNVDLRSFFGYDPINKQFKLLCMTVTHYRQQVNSKEHQVLTIEKGELFWRKIECLFPHYPEHRRNATCIHGVLYYVARSSKTRLIACFDVRSEEFRFINMPEGSNITYISALVNYKGKLGAVVYIYGSHGELWVLEDTEKEKWSKHIFGIPNTYMEVVGTTWATDTGEIVCVLDRWTNPFYVFYCNLERKSVRRVEIKGMEGKVLNDQHRNPQYYTVTTHVENVNFL